jgi:hypothetical protein
VKKPHEKGSIENGLIELFTAAFGVRRIVELGVQIYRLDYGMWENREPSVLQAVSAQTHRS